MPRDPYVVLGVSPRAPMRAVRAAYWALARRFHADGSEPDSGRMAEVNAAYEAIEFERRQGEGPQRLVATGPGLPAVPDHGRQSAPPSAGTPHTPSPAPGSLLWRITAAHQVDTPLLDFGEYAGWRIGDVARHDPRYLRWLSRHSMGIRYRKAIEAALGPDPEIGRRAAIVT